ncbi:MAG TPA: arylsulfotransferase family protein [Acidimicrobiales bacterium]|nr:arylsulfotransferase family protein [Acidimicrobiales bacterium]
MEPSRSTTSGDDANPDQPAGTGTSARAGKWSRRQVLVAGGGSAGALLAGGLIGGIVGYQWPGRGASPGPGLNGYTARNPGSPVGAGTALSFVSRPDLRPPRVRVTSLPGAPTAPGYVFLAARTYISSGNPQSGLMVIDRTGSLVWFRPLDSAPFDFRPQAYRGTPALTWWQGDVVDGYGQGTGEIANGSYKRVMRVNAGDGLKADLHELRLTTSGTALITAYEETTADLSSVGGPKGGKLLVGHAQEIDLATGRVLFDWSSADHVPLGESYQSVPQTGAYDYFHINSIAQFPNGDLLISARNTWAVYRVDRATGRVMWRLNGKKSDFAMGQGAHFYWQHDAEPHAGNSGPASVTASAAFTMTVFDDGASPSEENQSRGLVLDIDPANHRASLRRALLHPAGFLAANQGNVQLLADGRAFVGWGNQPYFSEFSAQGHLTLDGVMPLGYHSYRAYTADWKGTPSEPPAIAVRDNPAGGVVVYASWNGSTATSTWRVLAGEHPGHLGPVGAEESAGFETEIAVNSAGPFYQAVAVGASGQVLARSPAVRSSQ